MLPRDLKVRVEHRAREAGVSLGEFVRRSLETAVTQPGEIAEDPLFRDEGVYAGKSPSSYAADHDEYLYGDDE
jgi:hypothetical protein